MGDLVRQFDGHARVVRTVLEAQRRHERQALGGGGVDLVAVARLVRDQVRRRVNVA